MMFGIKGLELLIIPLVLLLLFGGRHLPRLVGLATRRFMRSRKALKDLKKEVTLGLLED